MTPKERPVKKPPLFIFLAACLLSLSMNSGASGEAAPAVLVTGASSGIGLRIVERLTERGYFVYAGARKAQDLQRLNAMENVEAVRLDVTRQDEIDAAVGFIKGKGRGLYGLVNNAGVVVFGPLIEVPVAQLLWQFDVNVNGPYRVTQAFAPLIIESQGRIVNISSIQGIFTNSLGGHYSMSKHAVEAYGDALAQEMAKFNVQVSTIEPGNYASNSGKSAANRLDKLNYWGGDTRYPDELKFMKLAASRESKAKDPVEVADAVQDALFSDTPKARYLVVGDKYSADITLRRAMRRMLQLNQDQPFTKSRDELVKLLDAELNALK